nr:hypothetical protein [Tanacetum cinerariifolium]
MAESVKRHKENSKIIKEIRASTDAAIRNEGASIKTLEIQIGQMSKVLQERGIGGMPCSIEPNPRDHVKSISTTKADSSEICGMGYSPYDVSGSRHRSIFSKKSNNNLVIQGSGSMSSGTTSALKIYLEMEQPNPTFSKILILDTEIFEQWKFKIQQYLQNEHYALWEVIEFGDSYEAPQEESGTGSASKSSAKKKERTVAVTTKDMQKRRNDVKARTTLLLALPDEHQLRFSKYKTAQELWGVILKTIGGNEATKKAKKNQLKQQYGNFKAEGSETLEQTFNRLGKGEVNTASIPTASTHVSPASADVVAASISLDIVCAYIASQSNGSQIKYEDINQIDKDDIEKMDIKWNMDLLRWDWSYMANEEENHALVADEEAQTEFALMAKSSSSSENEIFDNSLCSKSCKKNTDSLNTKITELSEKLNDTKTNLYHYKLGLSQVEARLVEFKTQEIKLCEKIRGLEFDLKNKNIKIEKLMNELEQIKKEKEGLDSKLTGFESASKDLDTLLGSQRSNKNKEGLGYSDVPPFLLKPSPSIENNSSDLQNNNSSIFENEESSESIMSKPMIKFVKSTDSPTVIKTNKVETIRKPYVKYDEIYRNTSKSPKFDHLAYDCGVWVNKGKTWPKTNYSHKSGSPRTIFHKTGRTPINRPNMNVAQPRRSSFSKPAHSYVRRPFQRKSAVKTQFRVLRVPTVNKKFPTGNSKLSTADLGNKGKVVKASACWIWRPKQNTSDKGPNSNSVSGIFKKYQYIDTQGKLKSWLLSAHDWQHILSILIMSLMIEDMCHLDKEEARLLVKVSSRLASANESMLWHRRLGHLNFKTMNKLVKHNLVKGLPSKCFENDHTYVACPKEKQHKESCKTKLVNLVSKPLHTLHMDLFGPTSNGVAKRRNRTLIEAARTMLADAKLPVTFWAEAVNTACYVQNRVLVNKSQNKTLYKLFNGRTPAIGFLKPFGCHVMILNTLDHLGKFDAKGDEGYFIGYSMSSKAFRVFNKRTKKVEENLHVDFLENKLIEKGARPNWLFDIDTLTNSMNYVPVVVAGTSSTHFLDSCNADAPESSGNSNPTITSTNPPDDQMETLTVESTIPTVSSPVPTACLEISPETTSGSRLISKRVTSQDETPSMDNISTLSNRFDDILRVTTNTGDTNGVEADLGNMEYNISASPTPTIRIHKDHPKDQIIGHVDTPVQTRHKSKEMEEHKPKKIFDALKDPSWVEAMQEELLQFKIQNDERRIVIKNKARLVAQGHTPKEGIDYEEVFIPVARIEAIKLFLAYGSFMGFTVYRMDVKSAFLYGTIDEEVYVMQPPGFQDPEFPDKVYKTLFIRRHRGDFILVQVYVDDIIFGSSNPLLYKEFEALMHDKFQMSAMSELNFFLGLQVLQKKGWHFSLTRQRKDRPGKDVDLHLYRSMIGSLMYPTASRPDIMFTICACARHQVTPKECHLDEVKRIFRYLKGHPKLGLWYPKDSPFDLVAYSDSDYGGATQDKKLTTGGYDNVADLLTKPFDAGSFQYLVTRFCDYHNMITILEKSEHNVDFHQIANFVEAYHIRIKTTDEGTQILATVDGKPRTISESSIRRNLKLNDEEGISTLPDAELFKNLALMGEKVIKTSALPHDSTPRVTSLAADERSMQQQIQELMDLCTRLQRQQTEMATKIAAQDLEISNLKARIKMLEDKDGGGAELSGEDATIKRMSLETGEEAGVEKSTERGSNYTEELVNVLTYMDAANILTSGVQAVSVPSVNEIPIVCIPTGSGMVPTVSPIFTTSSVVTPYSRRKGKEKKVESDMLKKKKLQEQVDVRMVREMEEEIARDAQRMNEQIVRDAKIARIHAEEELEKIELINELVKYQDHHAKILKYQAQQSKPLSKKQQREFYMSVLRRHYGWKTKHFKGMTLEEIRKKFIPVWKQIEDFVPMASKEEG